MLWRIAVHHSLEQPDFPLRKQEDHACRLHRIVDGRGLFALSLGPIVKLVRPGPQLKIDRAAAESDQQPQRRGRFQNVPMPATASSRVMTALGSVL